MGLVRNLALGCLMGLGLGLGLGCHGTKSTPPPIINSQVNSQKSFSPLQGTVNSFLYIYGSGFTGTTAVSLDGLALSAFTVDSDTQITAFVPTAASSGPIAVTNPGGTSTTSTSFYVVPVISSLSATTMSVGDTVTITGSGFLGATSPLVFYGPGSPGTPVSTPQPAYTVNSANQITTTVPAGIPAGSGYVFTVTVPGPSGGFLSNNPAGSNPNPTFTIL